MKSTGIVRHLDDLGRVVIPKEIRTCHELSEGDGLEIFVNGPDVILRKYQPGCSSCGNTEIVTVIKNVKLCRECAEQVHVSLARQEGKA